MKHEISEGFLQKVGRNYYMWLSIDGQKTRRKTGTDDPILAGEMLQEWRALAKIGHTQDSRLRYEQMRDSYLGSGKKIQGAALRDLDTFFKSIRVAAISVDKMKEFRQWRESQDRVLESKEETIAKEIAWRLTKAGQVTPEQKTKIEREAIHWVENGVKATTNKRLCMLRAMFNFLADEGKIGSADVPKFPILGGVDNKRRGFLEKEDLPKILEKLPFELRPIVRFIYETGMRSGAASQITWDMVDKHVTELHIPGSILKNDADLVLPLVDKLGKELKCFEGTIHHLKNTLRTNGPAFECTDLRSQWRLVCDALGYGKFDPKTRSYRGLMLHDFRRSAVRNMIRAKIPQAAAMAVSGHKTESMFLRYGIMDKSSLMEALA